MVLAYDTISNIRGHRNTTPVIQVLTAEGALATLYELWNLVSLFCSIIAVTLVSTE